MDGSAGEKREAEWEKEERPEEIDEALVEDQALVPPFDGMIIMMTNDDPKSTRPWWKTRPWFHLEGCQAHFLIHRKSVSVT